jgi:drug/metabolite transporter (DMT)-like permease
MSGTAGLGSALAFAALALFSTNIIVTRIAMRRLAIDAGFLIAVAVNVLFAALVTGAELLWRSDPLRIEAYAFAMFALAGVFTTYLGRWFFFEAVARLGAARASTFQVSSPLFTALVAWAFLGERLTITTAVAMVVVVYALYVVGSPGRSSPKPAVLDGETTSPRSRRRALPALVGSGLIVGLGSSMAYAVGNVLRGAAIHRSPEPALGALLGAITGVVLHIALNRSRRTMPALLRAADRRGVVLYAVSGALTITAQMLTIASMTYIPVSIAALITLCSPIFVIPASHLLFGREERMTARVLLGTALAFAGIAVIVLR